MLERIAVVLGRVATVRYVENRVLQEIYSYTCKGQKVEITHKQRRENVKYTRGHATIVCTKCCNIPVCHLVYRDWEDKEDRSKFWLYPWEEERNGKSL